MKKILSIFLTLALACTFLSFAFTTSAIDTDDTTEEEFLAALDDAAARADIDKLLAAYLVDALLANVGDEPDVEDALAVVDADAIDTIIEDLIGDYLAAFIAGDYDAPNPVLTLGQVVAQFLGELGDNIIDALDDALTNYTIVTLALITSFTFGLHLYEAPAITGDTALALVEGVYAAQSTGVYALTGYPAPTVTQDEDYSGAILWNAGKLDIGAGLAAGVYPVVLTASNGVAPDATLTFTLTVGTAPAISGPSTMTVMTGYSARSTGVYTLGGTPAVTVTLDDTYGGKITWNAGTKKLDIAAGLDVGTYPVVLTASTGVGSDATTSFTLTVKLGNTITGPSSMTLTEGYAATSTGVFTAGGDPVPTITAYGAVKVTWNDVTKKLDIAEGLTAGTYKIQLFANNGVNPETEFTFTLTVVPPVVTKYVGFGLFGVHPPYVSNAWNWFRFIVLFGWIWMWFIH